MAVFAAGAVSGVFVALVCVMVICCIRMEKEDPDILKRIRFEEEERKIWKEGRLHAE